jgi:hypothetical protein
MPSFWPELTSQRFHGGKVRRESLESIRVEVRIFDRFLVIIATINDEIDGVSHFNSIEEFLITIFGDKEVIRLASRLRVSALCVLNNGLHQLGVLHD